MHHFSICKLLVAVTCLLGSSQGTAHAAACLIDQDGDGVCDLWELTCLLSNGQRTDLLSPDSDGDNIRDDIEIGSSGVPTEALDTDGDCIIDACDDDSDNDGYSDLEESGCAFLCDNPVDTDGDGIPDYRDTDSDNDGVDDRDDPDRLDPTVPGTTVPGTNPPGGSDDPDNGDDDGDDDGDNGDGGGGGGGSGSDIGGGNGFDDGSSLYAAGGGCDSADGSGGSSWLVLLLVLGIASLRRERGALLVAAISFGTIAASSAEGFDNDITRTTVLGEGGVVVGNSDTLGPGTVRISALADYAYRPFELRDESDQRVSGVVDGVTSIDLRVGVGLPRGFEVSLLAPLVVDQQTTMGIAGRGLGDIGVAGKWSTRLGDRVGFAVAPELIVPTGRSEALAGDGGVGGQLQALADVELGRVRVGGMAGARLRAASGTSFGATHGQQILWGGLVDVTVARAHRVHVIGEVHGAAAAGSLASENPAEALAAVHWLRDGWILVAGGGAGLSSSVGAPAWRAFLGGAMTIGGRATPRRPPARLASITQPPSPTTPWEPAPQATQPEPDPDPDRDGILGAADRCPDEPETVNQHDDEDGCPDEKPAYVLTAGASLVLHDIHFETAKWRILPVSYRVLDDLAASLASQPDVRLRVEGHTDARGSATSNLILSQQRALAIVNYLVAAGVTATRLDYEGFGESRPIATNANADGMRQNRRVELRVLAGQTSAENRTW